MREGGWGVYSEPRTPDFKALLASTVSTLPLLWSPGSLARVAAQADNRVSIIEGLFGYSFILALLASSAVAGGEPFRDIFEYLRTWLEMSFWIGVGLTLLFGVWAALVASIARLAKQVTMRRLPPVAQARLRVLFLAPVCLLAPMAAWSLASALHGAAAPSCEFYGPAGKPAWLASPVFMVVGHSFWPLAMLCFGAIVTCVAGARLGSSVHVPPPRRAADLCPSCGYPLDGLTSRKCPECGEEGPALAAEAATLPTNA